MGVLYGSYDLLDSLLAYEIRPATGRQFMVSSNV